jgi:hypothetical protein
MFCVLCVFVVHFMLFDVECIHFVFGRYFMWWVGMYKVQ